MAKSKSFYGLRTGSTKAHTYQISLGNQVTKDRVFRVSNPKSIKQLIQRVIMLTAVTSYSYLRDIVDHSWQGVTKGARTQSRYMRTNLAMLRHQLIDAGGEWGNVRAFSALSLGQLAPQSYIISQGNLPTVPITKSTNFEIPSGSTYASLISALNARPGDQLTIVGIFRDGTSRTCSVKYCRIILQPQDASGNNLPLTTALLRQPKSQLNSQNLRNEGTDLWSFRINILTNAMTPEFNGMAPVAAGAILSRQSGKVWQRSFSQLRVYDNDFSFSAQEAIDYSTETINAASDLYLNNESDAANNLPAVVTNIKYNNEDFVPGTAIVAGKSLVINGQNLSPSTVQLKNGDTVYSPLLETPTSMSYTLAQIGTYYLSINGKIFATIQTVQGVTSPEVTSVNVNDVEDTEVPTNWSAPLGQLLDVTVTLSSSVQLPVLKTDFSLTNDSGTLGVDLVSSRSCSMTYSAKAIGGVGLLFRGNLIAVFDNFQQ